MARGFAATTSRMREKREHATAAPASAGPSHASDLAQLAAAHDSARPSQASELAQLAALHDSGALTDAEFTRAKKKLLS